MDITPEGHLEYVVRTRGMESRIRLTRTCWTGTSVTEADEPRLVEASVGCLLERQAAADLRPRRPDGLLCAQNQATHFAVPLHLAGAAPPLMRVLEATGLSEQLTCA